MSAVSIRRRRSEIETLDRDNPFIHPSPHAPWTVIPKPTDKTADLFEIAIVVWAVIVGLTMFALALNS